MMVDGQAKDVHNSIFDFVWTGACRGSVEQGGHACPAV